MTLRELSWENVSAGYGGTTVLEDVSLSIREGERVGIIGRNGAGKSTTLAACLGFAQLRAGRILADGNAIGTTPSFRRSRLGIGYVPQTRDIFRSLTVEENLLSGLKGGGRTRLEIAFDLFPRLKERRRNLGSALSGGEQQMLSIARALMGEPSILLLDEPLEGLAPVIAEEVMSAIKTLAAESKVGCLLVEQHVRLVLDFCERILVLERGRPVFYGSATDLDRRPEILDSAVGLKR